LLEDLKSLVCIAFDAESNYFNNYIKNQLEIFELKLISSYYYLRNKDECASKIELINNKYSITLQTQYFATRWDKFYSSSQNKVFDDRIKSYILNRDNCTCSYCNFTRNLQIHHVIPQDEHGSHSQYNLVSACQDCNSSIGDTIKIPNNWWQLHPESRNKYSSK